MEYASPNKSVFHTLFMGAAKKAGIVNPGVSWKPRKSARMKNENLEILEKSTKMKSSRPLRKNAVLFPRQACHGDELMYLFNVHLPLVLCE